MEILENNFNRDDDVPKIGKCVWCESTFRYECSDLHNAKGRGMYVICPCCGNKAYLDAEIATITPNNITFPAHFYHTSENENAVHVSNERVEQWIRDGIKVMREKPEWGWFYETGSGDTEVLILRNIDDEEYCIHVTQDYYEVTIPFEQIDYSLMHEWENG